MVKQRLITIKGTHFEKPLTQ